MQYQRAAAVGRLTSTRSNLQIVELLFVAAFWYLVLTSVFSVGQFYLERRFARGSSRSLPKTPFQRVKANLRTAPRL